MYSYVFLLADKADDLVERDDDAHLVLEEAYHLWCLSNNNDKSNICSNNNNTNKASVTFSFE